MDFARWAGVGVGRQMSKLVYIGMSISQARQLLWYIDQTDSYYGNQRQFRQREDDLIEHLQIGIDRATDTEGKRL